MRIAISGSHGIGKTTLACALAEKLNLPLLNEAARDIGGRAPYNFKSSRDILAAPKEVIKDFQMDVLNEQLKRQLRFQHRGFIADRSILDSIAYLNYYVYMSPKYKVYVQVITELVLHYTGDHYDFLVYCPIPNTQKEVPNDGYRLVDMESQQKVDEIIQELMHRVTCPVIELPPSERDRWLDMVLANCKDGKGSKHLQPH